MIKKINCGSTSGSKAILTPSSVHRMTEYGTDGEFDSRQGQEYFFVPKLPEHFWAPGDTSRGKAMRRETDHSSTATAEVKIVELCLQSPIRLNWPIVDI
jgi:hypothetical protein